MESKRQVSINLPMWLWQEVMKRGKLDVTIQSVLVRLLEKGLQYENNQGCNKDHSESTYQPNTVA